MICTHRHYWFACKMIAALVILVPAENAVADALVVTKAMKATTIAEIFVEQEQIRVEIEIGAADIPAFLNIFPDELYQRFTRNSQPLGERKERFFSEEWVLQADGRVLRGKPQRVIVDKRVVRDEITGEPLAEQPTNADIVIRLSLLYELNGHPQALTIQPPLKGDVDAASIGFVCYHDGVPVNDFRYLSHEATLDLDWEDPWYSRFRHRNLWRQFDAPLSVFLYVEPYEVRKEIIIRPMDVQHWLDLGLDKDGVIPAERQEELKRQIAEFLAGKNSVMVDGQEVQGQLDRIHFIYRSLRTTGIIEPPVDLPTASATLGVIFVYPIAEMPKQVSMNWELFTPRISSIPAVASDEAGGLPGEITPENPTLVWKNYLTTPPNTELSGVAPPPAPSTLSIPLLSIGCGVAVVILLHLAWRQWRARRVVLRIVVFSSVATMALGFISFPYARFHFTDPFANQPTLTTQETNKVLETLLLNVYRSFESHDEKLIYDRLAQSISGDLLADVYLQTRESMEVKNQGGLRISVKQVEVKEIEPPEPLDSKLAYRCRWNVSGWIGHWGHVHARENEHFALITIADRDGQWKITAMEMLDEQPEEASLDSASAKPGQ